jgi:hypothetical protein
MIPGWGIKPVSIRWIRVLTSGKVPGEGAWAEADGTSEAAAKTAKLRIASFMSKVLTLQKIRAAGNRPECLDNSLEFLGKKASIAAQGWQNRTDII